jgi:hypothetical protein
MTFVQWFEFAEILLAAIVTMGSVALVLIGNPEADRLVKLAQENTQLVRETVTKLNDQFTGVIELMRTLVKKL